jgi:hypothetical protein
MSVAALAVLGSFGCGWTVSQLLALRDVRWFEDKVTVRVFVLMGNAMLVLRWAVSS